MSPKAIDQAGAQGQRVPPAQPPADARPERREQAHAQDRDRAQRPDDAVRDLEVGLDGGEQRPDRDDLGPQDQRDADEGDQR